jgi:CRISPR/Cas system-associated endonuclease Cas1
MPPFNATSFRQSNWAERSALWASHTNAKKPKFRGDPKQPLVLCGHGVRLNIDHGALYVRHGLTHFPQKAEERFFFPGEIDLPSRIILVDGSGSISFDVLSWLAKQNIPLIRISWNGEIVCLAGTSGYAANPERLEWQNKTRNNHILRMEFCNAIITKKIEASILTLERSIPHTDKREIALEAAYAGLTSLDSKLPQTINEVRGLEANCAAAYFRSSVGIPIKWRKGSRRPIPPDWRAAVKSVRRQHS